MENENENANVLRFNNKGYMYKHKFENKSLRLVWVGNSLPHYDSF